MRYTIRLADDTCGTVNFDTMEDLENAIITHNTIAVLIQDENGIPCFVYGKPVEILE